MTKLLLSAAVLVVVATTGLNIGHVHTTADRTEPSAPPAEIAYTEPVVAPSASPTPSPEAVTPAAYTQHGAPVDAAAADTPTPTGGDVSVQSTEGVTNAPTTCSGRTHSTDTSENGEWTHHRHNSTDGDCSTD